MLHKNLLAGKTTCGRSDVIIIGYLSQILPSEAAEMEREQLWSAWASFLLHLLLLDHFVSCKLLQQVGC